MSEHAKKAAAMIRRVKPGFTPKVGMILGSGLGVISEGIKNATVIHYDELPGFSLSHVEGHGHKLHLGMLKGIPVMCFEGRAHTYEGIQEAITVLRTIIRTFKLLGGEILLTTNAVGSLRSEVVPGHLVIAKDHINFMFSNPLMGRNDDEFGERFVSMDDVYDPELRRQFMEITRKEGIPLTEGVYLATCGPTFETHAEIRAYKALGADTVGMSTVPEVIIARHCGLRVAAVSAVVNLAAGMSAEKLSHEGTLRGAKLAVGHLANLFLAFIDDLSKSSSRSKKKRKVVKSIVTAKKKKRVIKARKVKKIKKSK